MKPYFSVIIPYHNAPEYLVRLLTSLEKSKKTPHFEVIVVDDGSVGMNGADRIPYVKSLKKRRSRFMLRTVRLPRNRGPAVARNRGVTVARGQFVVFLDNDVEVFPDTLENIFRIVHDDPDVVALTGVWVKEQRSPRFFPNFKALRDWSYWINERDKSGYYFLFSTRIAAIKRAVFLRLGGFNEEYPAPLVEDIELTYRIARRYAIIFAPDVRVRHEFEEFWPIAKKYFLRAYYWTKLYASRKKFDPVATTLTEAVTAVSGVGVMVLGITHIVVSVATRGLFTPVSGGVLIVFLTTVLFHLLLVGKFLRFVYDEKGFWFMVKSFATGIILYCFIFGGRRCRAHNTWKNLSMRRCIV